MLEQFAIYRNPSDFPGQLVVRRWVILERGHLTVDHAPLYVGDDLKAARRAVPGGCMRLGRTSSDDPAILEVWL